MPSTAFNFDENVSLADDFQGTIRVEGDYALENALPFSRPPTFPSCINIAMSRSGPKAYAFNRTRNAYLATNLIIASTHWTRFRGLMATDASAFLPGRGLWLNPSHGIHTFAMRFPIDALYLDRDRIVIHLEEGLKPWRVAPVRANATSVLELPPGIIQETQTAIGDQIDILLEHPIDAEAA